SQQEGTLRNTQRLADHSGQTNRRQIIRGKLIVGIGRINDQNRINTGAGKKRVARIESLTQRSRLNRVGKFVLGVETFRVNLGSVAQLEPAVNSRALKFTVGDQSYEGSRIERTVLGL